MFTSLDPALDYLARYGKPMLWMSDDGNWLCVLNVHMLGEGTRFEVSASTPMPTPLMAVQSCGENLVAAMSKARSLPMLETS